MTRSGQPSAFSVSLRVTAGLVLLLVMVFAAYVYSEKQIDRANERRFQTRLLADELRQSSDDLTRMVRTYVQTGKPEYKQYYQDILAIREGTKPRPLHYDGPYWDLVLQDGTPPRADSSETVALLDLMRQAGIAGEELAQLELAKRNSDQLTALEYTAMALVETPGPGLEQRRYRASQMLHGAEYLQAKGRIMGPISTFYELADRRTARDVYRTEQNAVVLRTVFVLLGLAILLALWHSYRALRKALGAPLDDVHTQIARLGAGDFAEVVPVPAGLDNSVMGWLAQTHRQLQALELARDESDVQLRRLARYYAALSACNQAVVRCKNPQELFEQVCHAIIDHGGLKMVWVGLIDAQAQWLEPAHFYGEGVEFLKDFKVPLDASIPQGRGPSATTVRTDQPFWCQDYQNDPATVSWHAVGKRFGWAASASLPLHRDGKVIGTFNVYSGELHAFDSQAQALLEEMVTDLDYALGNFDREAARTAAELQRAESETRLLFAYKGSNDGLWDWDLARGHVHYSPRWWEMLGYAPGELPDNTDPWRSTLHPQDLARVEPMLSTLLRSRDDSFSFECRLKHRNGHYLPVLVRGFVARDAKGHAVRVAGTNMDLTSRVQNQQMDALRAFMLERLTSDMPLQQVLRDFVVKIEDALSDALCSILLLEEDGMHLGMGAAPSLPDFYNDAIHGAPIGPRSGSCGTAAFRGERVIVEDIATDPLWTDYRDVAARAGLASCWSDPIRSGGSKVLGTFAIYHRTPSLPSPHDLAIIEMASHLTAIAIERKNAEMQLQLVAKVFEQGGESIMITDSEVRIVRVNRAFCKITGYSESEAAGRNPNMLSSGRQDADFYKAMWQDIQTHGQWQGEIWNRRKDGSVYPEWLSISLLRDVSGAVSHYVAIASDISKRKEDEEHIRMLADFDPLTGLPNRRLLRDRIDTALSHAQRQDEPLALMFLDLDRFKNVNDSLGHHIGDELLVEVAQRLKSVLREQDTVCRLGGDEFVLLCPETDAAGAAHVATKLLECTGQRYQIHQQDLVVTFSIGIALYPDDGDTFEALSMSADSAMYRAKQAGRNAYRFFTPEMQVESSRTLQLENGLRRALELDQMELVYQPQISLQDGRVVGAEALLRWQHPVLGAVSPAEFIPIAEESGLILPIGEWVLRTAAWQLRTWRDAGMPLPQLAVNLSAVQFRHADLPALVSLVLAETGLPPQCLELELTEGVAMTNPLGAIAVMNDLHARGVRMSIDDFGTGYSSLSYLKRFHVYKLKIDQSFVRDLTEDPEDKAIVAAIIGMARSLGFQTIAEGVETQGQMEFLRAQGCDEVQGYFYSKPLPAAQFAEFVRKHGSDPETPQ